MDEGRRACTTWEDDVAPALLGRCGKCHGGSAPAGGYDVSTYQGALVDGHGNSVAVAGAPDSLLLATLDPAKATEPHKGFSDLLPTLESWVVECRVSVANSAVHPGGILNPADPDFHGRVLRSSSYKFDDCRTCHGMDLAGGKAKVSCFSCHKDGPDAFFGDTCTGCHGAPPSTGAHLAHAQKGAAGAALAIAYDCTECHVKPAKYTDVGHVFDGSGQPLAEPAMSFGMLAQSTYAGVTRGGPPAYDRATGTCGNVYCHGGALPSDKSATITSPSWKGGDSQAACGTCHGAPPATASHASATANGGCAGCHPLVADAAGKIVDAKLHVDGKVSLGSDGTGKCDGCHGSGMYGAPPRDLSGNTSTSAIGVGAHAAHLGAQHHLRGPVACGDCHLVPEKVDSAGHIDHPLPAEVFPNRPGFSSLAANDGAKPAWDHAKASCSNTYCHGGGTRLSGDGAPGLVRAPVWTAGTSQAQCGGCHGIPPVDKDHTPSMLLKDCYKCHGKTMDSTGAIIVTGSPGQEKSSHIDGVVDGN